MKEEIMKSFLEFGSRKVKKESLEEFLNSYKKDDLIRLAIYH